MLFPKSIQYVVTSLLLFLVVSCKQEKETNTQILAISNVSIATDKDGKIGTNTEICDANAQTFHCVVSTNQKQAGAKIRVGLIAVAAEGYENFEVRVLDQTTDSIQTSFDFPFSLARPWFKGKYKCDVYLNDSLVQVKNFEMQ
jgi:hypothetical protein